MLTNLLNKRWQAYRLGYFIFKIKILIHGNVSLQIKTWQTKSYQLRKKKMLDKH